MLARYEALLRMTEASPLDGLRQLNLTADQLEILTIFVRRMGNQKACDVREMLGLIEAEMHARRVVERRRRECLRKCPGN